MALPIFRRRHRRPQDRTLGFVCSHIALDRGSLRRRQASCKGWAMQKWLKLSGLWPPEDLSRDFQDSCIYRMFFLFPTFLIGVENPQKPKSVQIIISSQEKRKSEFWRAPCFTKLSTTPARLQRVLSLCPPHLLEDGSLHFKSCCKSSTERTWKMRNKVETDKSHLN